MSILHWFTTCEQRTCSTLTRSESWILCVIQGKCVVKHVALIARHAEALILLSMFMSILSCGGNPTSCGGTRYLAAAQARTAAPPLKLLPPRLLSRCFIDMPYHFCCATAVLANSPQLT